MGTQLKEYGKVCLFVVGSDIGYFYFRNSSGYFFICHVTFQKFSRLKPVLKASDYRDLLEFLNVGRGGVVYCMAVGLVRDSYYQIVLDNFYLFLEKL